MTNPKQGMLQKLNLIQQISFDEEKSIFKQLCKKCGGKTFYQSIIMVGPNEIKNELVSCEVCEGGFIYGVKK